MGAGQRATPRCDGCLDTGRCWVCLGRGVLEGPAISLRPCHRCEGTGRCWLCQVTRVIDISPAVEITEPTELLIPDPDDADRGMS